MVMVYTGMRMGTRSTQPLNTRRVRARITSWATSRARHAGPMHGRVKLETGQQALC